MPRFHNTCIIHLLHRPGPVQLAGVGVALSMFNTVSKLFNMPLLSVTTSAVASASGRSQREGKEEAVAAAMSSALLIAVIVGLFQVGRVGLLVYYRVVTAQWLLIVTLNVLQSVRRRRFDAVASASGRSQREGKEEAVAAAMCLLSGGLACNSQ